MPLYSIVFQCKVLGGTLKPHPLECQDVGFFSQDSLPEPLAGSGNWVDQAFRAVRNEPIEVQFGARDDQLGKTQTKTKT